ncbi:MAG: YSC84-related protein [Vibrio sp.]
MKKITQILTACLLAVGLLSTPAAFADSYDDAIVNFQRAPETERYFDSAYGYALFPTVGKGAFIVGGAYGEGRVFRGKDYIGDTKLSQLSVGFSFGGEGYSEIIFFKNKRALDKFTEGNFEFGAQTSAVAINVGANAQVGTTGNSATAGQSGAHNSSSASYVNDMAVFIVTKGGLMIDASVAGQKFDFQPKK